jgi:hypothetical protein
MSSGKPLGSFGGPISIPVSFLGPLFLVSSQ